VSAAVLLINSLGTGGAERAVAAAAAGLRALGRDVRILCLERNAAPVSVPPEIPVSYLSNLTTSSGVLLKFAALPFLALRLSSHLRQLGVHAVMSHLFRANFVNVLARVLAGSRHKAVLVNHTRISRLRDEGIQGRITWTLSRLLYIRADVVASVSTGAAAECARLLGLPAGKAITLYDPIDTSGPARQEREAARVIAAVGRLVALKRFEDILDAFSAIKGAFPGLLLKIIGDGPARGGLEQRAAALGISDQVHFLGELAAPAQELAASDVFVSTSAVEGFGMAIVEAMAAGVPVIAADCAYGPREILSPFTDSTVLLQGGSEIEIAPNGILYPVGSVKALQKALQCILTDGALRKELGQKGPARAAAFSVPRSVSAYEKLLFA
jgi:glycosyltransferase involved in cell wall biosynthesis